MVSHLSLTFCFFLIWLLPCFCVHLPSLSIPLFHFSSCSISSWRWRSLSPVSLLSLWLPRKLPRTTASSLSLYNPCSLHSFASFFWNEQWIRTRVLDQSFCFISLSLLFTCTHFSLTFDLKLDLLHPCSPLPPLSTFLGRENERKKNQFLLYSTGFTQEQELTEWPPITSLWCHHCITDITRHSTISPSIIGTNYSTWTQRLMGNGF